MEAAHVPGIGQALWQFAAPFMHWSTSGEMKRDKAGHAEFGKWKLGIQFLNFLCQIDFALETLPNLTPAQRFWRVTSKPCRDGTEHFWITKEGIFSCSALAMARKEEDEQAPGADDEI